MSSFSAITATTASQVMLPQNSARLGVLIKSRKINTDTVWLGLVNSGTGLTVANGFPLEPGESFFGLTSDADIRSADFNSQITILANSGTQDVRFVEF